MVRVFSDDICGSGSGVVVVVAVVDCRPLIARFGLLSSVVWWRETCCCCCCWLAPTSPSAVWRVGRDVFHSFERFIAGLD